MPSPSKKSEDSSTDTSITIRPANPEDIPALQALIDVSVRTLSASYYNQDQIESALANVFGVDSQLIEDGTYFVAEIAGQIVGAGGWSKRKALFGGDQFKADHAQLLNPATDAARIRAFYVHPEWSRRGIGRKIAQACEDAAKTAGFKMLELAATLPGEPLYLAMGYKNMGACPIPLPGGRSLPCFRMEKRLE